MPNISSEKVMLLSHEMSSNVVNKCKQKQKRKTKVIDDIFPFVFRAHLDSLLIRYIFGAVSYTKLKRAMRPYISYQLDVHCMF